MATVTVEVFVVLLYFSASAFAQGGIVYNYSLSGQDWTDVCAVGKRQSPINIVKKDAVDKGTIESFSLRYVPSNQFTIQNTGHVIQITPFYADENKLILGDGSSYALRQFHFHGFSEHSFDGLFSPLEVHFVHVSEDDPEKYAVVSCFLRLDPNEGDNNQFTDIIENIPSSISSTNVTGPHYVWSNICLKGKKTDGSGKGPIFRVYTYLGSLTTPGCGEVVEWFVLAKPQYISTSQVLKFYDAVATVTNGERTNNRLPQPINGRTVETFYAHR